MVNAEELGYEVEPSVKVLEGQYRKIMPVLLKGGYTPQTPANVMDARNESVGTPHQDVCWNNYFNTSMGVSGTDREVTFAPEILLSVTPETKLTAGGLALPGDYSGKVIRVSRADLGPLGRSLKEKEALAHRGWQILAGEDQDRLLAKYVGNAFKLGKDMFDYDKMMGFYVADDGNVRALVLGGTNGGAFAGDGGYLGDDLARLVGVREVGAQKSSSGSLDSVVEKLARKHGTNPADIEKAFQLYAASKKLNIK